MLLYNLAEPDWISVPCNKRLLSHTLCYLKKEDHGLLNNTQHLADYSYCLINHLILKQKCHIFIWISNFNSSDCSDLCTSFEALP